MNINARPDAALGSFNIFSLLACDEASTSGQAPMSAEISATEEFPAVARTPARGSRIDLRIGNPEFEFVGARIQAPPASGDCTKIKILIVPELIAEIRFAFHA